LAERGNLGRGLGDLMSEVSGVRAVPVPPVPPAPARPPPAVQPAPRPSRAVPLLSALCALLAVLLAWSLWHQLTNVASAPVSRSVERVQPQVRLADADVPPVTPVPVEADAVTVEPLAAPAPAPAPMDPLAWVEGASVPGARIIRQGAAAQIVFDEALFSRRAELREEAGPLLQAVAKLLAPHAAAIRLDVAGHTDSDPVTPGGPYRDNAALGLARAAAAADVLRAQAALPAGRLTVSSPGGEQAPYPNDTPENKRRNRTVTMRVFVGAP
jgi:outer membrane protein OmpA-like peptidoglycan-associated protein